MEEKTLNLTLRDFSKPIEILQFIAIFLCAFILPLTVTKSQVVVGTIVNAALVLTALNVKGPIKNISVVMLPSIVTILSGYVFKSASPLMVYMIPGIWLGNFALVYTFKKMLVNKKLNYFVTGIVGIVLKVAIIFGAFSILNAFNVFPAKMVDTLRAAMSYKQLITATLGVTLASGIYFAERESK